MLILMLILKKKIKEMYVNVIIISVYLNLDLIIIMWF